MESKGLIKTLRLQNLLSYGDKSEEIALGPLNVLIGLNASGKSNLIEAVSLLRGAPRNLAETIRIGGGISEWLWKGGQSTPEANIEALISYPYGLAPLYYRIVFTMVGQHFRIESESIASQSSDDFLEFEPFFYSYEYGSPKIRGINQLLGQKPGRIKGRDWQDRGFVGFNQEQSILSLLRDPINYPEIAYLSNVFERIKIFQGSYFGRAALTRGAQDPNLPDDFLLENATNLVLLLQDFQHKIGPKRRIVEEMKKLNSAMEDITTKIQGGTAQLFIHEKGLSQPIPAMRLSEGTIRYLCLLVILCHPTPPPLLCIEEPELGLHPDVLPIIAELLVEASQRTQLIVTTHSDVLVSALSEAPDSVLVCERDDEGTHLRRLEPASLNEWLEKYSLGELWRMGEIGGN